MTRASLREYAAKQRERYQGATRAEKHRLLDEVVAVTGIHRKAAIRLLRRPPRPRATAGARRPSARLRPGGGRRRRGPVAGQRADRRPPAPALRAGAPGPPPPLRRAHARPRRSTSSCGRPAGPPSPACWAPPAPRYPRRGATITRPGHRASGTRSPSAPSPSGTDARPGFLEVDLVAHCGVEHRGLLPVYPLRGGHHHRVDRAGARLGQGPDPGRRGRRPRPDAPAHAPGRPGQRQRLRVHQSLACAITVAATRWPSPAAARGRRTTVPMSSRRTAPSSASSSAMIASPPGPPMRNSRASTPGPPAREFLPARGEARDARPATAPGATASTIAPRRRTSACAPPASWRPKPDGTRSPLPVAQSAPAPSGPRARTGAALDPRRARPAPRPGEYPDSHPPPQVALLEAPRRWLR